MGIIQSGILSKVSGKVAGVVGGSWKDKAYLRGYVKPANPNTTAQQTQRTKFSDCVAFAKPLVGQVFNAYTDKYHKNMSGFNYFIKDNIDEFDGSPSYDAVHLTTGTLSQVLPSAAVYNTPDLDIAFDKNLGNNGADSDKVFAVAYDSDSGLFYFAADEVARSTETITVPMVAGLTATNIYSWIWAARYDGTVLDIISRDKTKVGEAP